jgi:hypothetical protein
MFKRMRLISSKYVITKNNENGIIMDPARQNLNSRLVRKSILNIP